MVQAAACRVALYGFNSHPRLHNINARSMDEPTVWSFFRFVRVSRKRKLSSPYSKLPKKERGLSVARRRELLPVATSPAFPVFYVFPN
jgi:hypothetical protein